MSLSGRAVTTRPPAPARIASLLVVDDSPVQRAHTVSVCRSLGLQLIYEAHSGAQALELLDLLVLPPEMLIIDLEMPGMDGVELIQQLHRRGIRLPLIVASRREMPLIQSVELMASNLGLPVLGGLRKPLAADTLGALMQRFGGVASHAAVPSQAAPELPIDRDMLAGAIEAGEIHVWYQPKVDIQTGIVRGIEALARWRPEGGSFVRPDRFVALAEREGLIHALTLSVTNQSLAQAASWNAHGLRLTISINLAPCLLDDPSLVDEMLALTRCHEMSPDQVVLEITESSLVDCRGAAIGVLARLRLKGFGLSIDDYGTGFSSMQQLARIPFTELKIDRSFVHGAHQRSHSRVILKSALDMAGQLGLTTVAEGVETLDDWRLLQEFGCIVAQGYLIAKPMPALDMLDWLKAHTGRLHEFRRPVAAQEAMPRSVGRASPGRRPGHECVATTAPDAAPAAFRVQT